MSFNRCLSELAQMVSLPYFQESSTQFSDRLHFLSPFLDVAWMSMSAVYFPVQLGSGFFAYRMFSFDQLAVLKLVVKNSTECNKEIESMGKSFAIS